MAKRKQRKVVIPLNPKPVDSRGIIVAMSLQLLDLVDKQKQVLLRLLEMNEYDVKIKAKVDPELVLWLVHNIFKVDVREAPDKTEDVVLARHAARYLLHVYSRLSSVKIAPLTGTGDHSTVLRSIKMIPDLKRTVEGFKEKLELCIKKLEPEMESYGNRKTKTG